MFVLTTIVAGVQIWREQRVIASRRALHGLDEEDDEEDGGRDDDGGVGGGAKGRSAKRGGGSPLKLGGRYGGGGRVVRGGGGRRSRPSDEDEPSPPGLGDGEAVSNADLTRGLVRNNMGTTCRAISIRSISGPSLKTYVSAVSKADFHGNGGAHLDDTDTDLVRSAVVAVRRRHVPGNALRFGMDDAGAVHRTAGRRCDRHRNQHDAGDRDTNDRVRGLRHPHRNAGMESRCDGAAVRLDVLYLRGFAGNGVVLLSEVDLAIATNAGWAKQGSGGANMALRNYVRRRVPVPYDRIRSIGHIPSQECVLVVEIRRFGTSSVCHIFNHHGPGLEQNRKKRHSARDGGGYGRRTEADSTDGVGEFRPQRESGRTRRWTVPIVVFAGARNRQHQSQATYERVWSYNYIGTNDVVLFSAASTVVGRAAQVGQAIYSARYPPL